MILPQPASFVTTEEEDYSGITGDNSKYILGWSSVISVISVFSLNLKSSAFSAK